MSEVKTPAYKDTERKDTICGVFRVKELGFNISSFSLGIVWYKIKYDTFDIR